MARIPYADEESSTEIKKLADEIRSQRGGRTLHVYNMLLNAPPLAATWVPFFTAVRQKCQLDSRYRELASLRVGLANDAMYQYSAHIPFALKDGVRQAQIDALPDWRSSSEFDAVEKAVLAYTDAMTDNVHVPDEIFDAVRKHFDEREIVELTVTIAAYNAMSRVLVALQVDGEQSHARKNAWPSGKSH